MALRFARKQLATFLFWTAAAFAAKDPIVRDVTIAGTKAYLVQPGEGTALGPGIVFVHWLEPHAPDSNRTQFLAQAIELAHSGVTSVLPETMWSDPEWFNRRNPDRDYEASLEQVARLRQCIDFLLAQPRVDPKRIAYVGHDFGMMYGLLLAKDEKRITAWALQAGTSDFADWFLLGRAQVPQEEKAKVRARLEPLRPIHFIGKLGAPLLLQFGMTDPYVPRARAEALQNAAQAPKDVRYYEAGHGLNRVAITDRMEWLRRTLSIPQPPNTR